MNRYTLGSLILILVGMGSLGCSRVSTHLPESTFANRKLTDDRQDLSKPSPCIKWDSASARSIRPPRKTKRASANQSL